MLRLKQLERTGVHDVFDSNMENSFEIVDGEETLGYVCYEMRDEETKRIWIEFLLAEYRGNGDGETMIHALFEKGYEDIQGSAIYGPHFFWKSIGAVFEDEVQEEDFDGIWFTLTREDFYTESK